MNCGRQVDTIIVRRSCLASQYRGKNSRYPYPIYHVARLPIDVFIEISTAPLSYGVAVYGRALLIIISEGFLIAVPRGRCEGRGGEVSLTPGVDYVRNKPAAPCPSRSSSPGRTYRFPIASRDRPRNRDK